MIRKLYIYIFIYNQIEHIKIDEEIQNEMMRDFSKNNERKWFKKERVSQRTSSYINKTNIFLSKTFKKRLCLHIFHIVLTYINYR